MCKCDDLSTWTMTMKMIRLRTYRPVCQHLCLKELNWHISKFANCQINFVEDIGVEPMTLCVQGRCSSQLS